MNVQYSKGIIKWAHGLVQHYNPDKYWKYREYVISQGGGTYFQIHLPFLYKKM